MTTESRRTPSVVALVTVGELLSVALTTGVWALLPLIFPSVVFDYTVPLGAALGAGIMIVNFLLLAKKTTKLLAAAAEERGTREMTEEEIADFTAKHQTKVRAAMAANQMMRDLIMIAALVGCYFAPWFHPIAALIPFALFRPILTVAGLAERRSQRV